VPTGNFPTRRFERVSSFSLSSKSSSNEEKPLERDFEFNAQAYFTVVGGQSLIIPVSLLASFFLQTPNSGFGVNFNVNDLSAWTWGCVYTIPLFLLALYLDTIESSYPSLQEVTFVTQRSVLTLLGGKRRPLLALGAALALGFVAGVGEELLFRGVFQYELSERFGTPLALTASSIVFGLVHFATPLYAALAALASAYFGALYIASDNLGLSMICHGVYDVGALLWAHWIVTGMTHAEQKELMRL